MSAQPRFLTILIVEDEPLVRLFAADVLQGAGYQIMEAEAANEALTALTSYPEIDLLLSDVLLPGTTSGLSLADWVLVNRPNMPVILSSGTGAFSRHLEGRKFVTFLAKPYNAHEFLGAVAGLLPARD